MKEITLLEREGMVEFSCPCGNRELIKIKLSDELIKKIKKIRGVKKW